MEATDSVEEAIELQHRHRRGGGTGGKKSGLDRVGLLMEAGFEVSTEGAIANPGTAPVRLTSRQPPSRQSFREILTELQTGYGELLRCTCLRLSNACSSLANMLPGVPWRVGAGLAWVRPGGLA